MPDAAHVVVGDLDDLGEAEHARVARRLQLLLRHLDQCLDILHYGLTVQLLTAGHI